ncbi:hypothetical protein FGO68_gene5850 [Halteria grandinella]|uniref:Uncharacterized protein n=1 Tax=Halteria grandinella TaxID=5974 RepID=A0A8J8SZ44_HALGN|nr:hypothetical protein FGO68_gene5850 [Halteria grandinella]
MAHDKIVDENQRCNLALYKISRAKEIFSADPHLLIKVIKEAFDLAQYRGIKKKDIDHQLNKIVHDSYPQQHLKSFLIIFVI